MIFMKQKMKLLTLCITSLMLYTNTYASGNAQHPFLRQSLNNNGCYKQIGNRCVSYQEYLGYDNYLKQVATRINQNTNRLNQEYRFNNGRLRQLPNGRFLAKENDVEYVNQEVVCSENDYFLKGKTSCYACEKGYQNTLAGGYGGSTPYNNNIACSVLGKGNAGNQRINGGGFNPTAAIALGTIGLGAIMGGGGQAGNMGGGGSSGNPSMATAAFVCLEYFTNSNGMTTGGEHLKYSQHRQKCQAPMSYYYNNLEVYYCTPYGCYYNSPATIQLRKMWLYTNPYIYIGNTMAQSDIIAHTRTLTSTYGPWKQVYVYPN